MVGWLDGWLVGASRGHRESESNKDSLTARTPNHRNHHPSLTSYEVAASRSLAFARESKTQVPHTRTHTHTHMSRAASASMSITSARGRKNEVGTVPERSEATHLASYIARDTRPEQELEREREQVYTKQAQAQARTLGSGSFPLLTCGSRVE